MYDHCKPGCDYSPITEQLCYFHSKVEAGVIDGYMDSGARICVPLGTTAQDDAVEGPTELALFDQHRRNVLNRRAISNWLIDTEPLRYRSFCQGDWQSYARLMGLTDIKPGLKRKVSQSGGIVVARFDPSGRKLPPYARFDDALYFDKPPRNPKFPGQGKTRYTQRPGYGTKHIDIHPLAAPRLGTGEPVYFCLEGCLKADAVLSAGGLAISSTSVTTWKNADLIRLLPRLKSSSVVYVVPDSDYYSSARRNGHFNEFVLFQTRAAAQWLKTRGVNARIGVPWTGQPGVKTGVDDFLALGYRLDQLTPEEPFPPYPGFAIGPSVRLTNSQARVLDYLTSLNGYCGAFLPRAVAKALGLSRQTVRRAYKRFESMGIMVVWRGAPCFKDGHWGNELHGFFMPGVATSYSEYLKRLKVPSPHARAGQPRPGRGWDGSFALLEAESA